MIFCFPVCPSLVLCQKKKMITVTYLHFQWPMCPKLGLFHLVFICMSRVFSFLVLRRSPSSLQSIIIFITIPSSIITLTDNYFTSLFIELLQRFPLFESVYLECTAKVIKYPTNKTTSPLAGTILCKWEQRLFYAVSLNR